MDEQSFPKIVLKWALVIIATFTGAWLIFESIQKKETKDQIHIAEMNKLLDAQEKKTAKEHITELLEVSDDRYRVKNGGLGGISGPEISVVNHSGYLIDLVMVEVQYIKQNGNVFKTEKITFQNLKPTEMQHQYAPDSKRGTQLKTSIILVKSVELGL